MDPDILVLAPLSALAKVSSTKLPFLLTPHQSEPELTAETVRENELLTLQHGIFNLGFLGVKNCPEGHRFARWWADRLRDFCYDDIPIGLFTDQRWPDLIPAFFPNHKVLRDPAYNVAYWNLTQRRIEGRIDQGFTVGGQPLVFFHFSGIDSGRDLSMLRSWGTEISAFLELREWYLAECDRHGEAILSSVPWGYGFFANGDPILRSQRLQYRHNPDLQARFPDPFQSFPVQVSPLAPPQERAGSVGPYRIFLIAAPADEQYVDGTLAALKSTTVRHDQLRLVGPSLSRDIQSIAVDATRYEDFAAHVLQNFADQDIILLRAGALTPPQWDLRLALTAARHPSALTVSPLDRRVLDEGSLLASFEPDELDRLCYFYRQLDDREVATFSQDCVFISSSGARDLTASHRDLRLSTLIDYAARQRWQHLLTTHLCLSFRCPRTNVSPAPTSAEQRSLDLLRASLRNHAGDVFHLPRTITGVLAGATLHIAHNWGGGIEQWLRNFSEADATHEHLVLKSVGPKGLFGGQLELHRYGQEDHQILQSWDLAPGIRATAISHAGYRQILQEITNEFSISRVIVSSVIGHSLDCLRSGLPTIFVCHDYYPYCSAINLTFGETCRSCEAPRLEACLEENPFNSHFPNVVRRDWLVLRDEFLQSVVKNSVALVAPSPSVRSNYLRLAPELAASFRVIPHGLPSFQCQQAMASSSSQLLRVLLLGNLIPHKGVFLLDSILPELLTFAELTLAGCLESGDRFADHPKIRVIPYYRQEELAPLVAEIRPDLALFLSVWPETFSYTLHEVQSLCVPPVATNLGAFLDAIEEGVTGFLCEPEPLSFINRLRTLAANRSLLAGVQRNLAGLKRRSLTDMVEDYAAVLPDEYSADRYFTGPHASEPIRELELQIYWADGGGAFSEANSFRFAPYHRERQAVRLYVPAQRGSIGKLRFDPGSAAGLMQMNLLTLFRKSGDVLWSSNDCRALLASAPYANVVPLSATVVGLTGNDPQIELPLSRELLADLAQNGGYLEVDCAWYRLEEHMAELLAAPASMFEKLLQEVTLSREQLRNLHITLDHNQQQISTQEQELALSRKHSENLAALHQNTMQSFSWKVTKPLRLAATLGRKFLGGR